jgi:hypothetical protein
MTNVDDPERQLIEFALVTRWSRRIVRAICSSLFLLPLAEKKWGSSLRVQTLLLSSNNSQTYTNTKAPNASGGRYFAYFISSHFPGVDGWKAAILSDTRQQKQTPDRSSHSTTLKGRS